MFWYSCFLVFLGLVLLTGLTRRAAVSVGILMAVIIGATYVHINKFASRGAPLLPEDFQIASEAASLTKFIDIGELVRTGLYILVYGRGGSARYTGRVANTS